MSRPDLRAAEAPRSAPDAAHDVVINGVYVDIHDPPEPDVVIPVHPFDPYHRRTIAPHRAHALQYGQDPAVICLSHVAPALWFTGYPEQARRRSEDGSPWHRRSATP